MPSIKDQQENLFPSEELATNSAMDLDPIRVESVLSRLPVHNLTRQENLDIQIERRNAKGDLELLWMVSPSRNHGDPKVTAYKLDTIVINRRIDEMRPAVPKTLRLGSLRGVLQELGMVASGSNIESIKKALKQNAGATITAKVPYRNREGRECYFEATFSRYSIVMTGEKLPTGETADAVYIILNDIYQEFLSQAPIRPLDRNYLLTLPATSQRLYELLSYRVFAALKHGHRRASMLYSDYCASAPLPRQTNRSAILKQMYQIHRPHLNSGYIAKVDYERVPSQSESIDLMVYYTPGPRAVDEYRTFNAPKKLPEPREGNWETDYKDDLTTVLASRPNAGLPKPPTNAEQLVTHFMLERFGHARRRIAAKEIRLAESLLQEHSLETAKGIVSEAVKQANAGEFRVLWFGGLANYLHELSKRTKDRVIEREQAEKAKRNAQLFARAEAFYESLSATEIQQHEAQLLPSLVDAGWGELLEDPTMKSSLLKHAIIQDIARGFDTPAST